MSEQKSNLVEIINKIEKIRFYSRIFRESLYGRMKTSRNNWLPLFFVRCQLAVFFCWNRIRMIMQPK